MLGCFGSQEGGKLLFLWDKKAKATCEVKEGGQTVGHLFLDQFPRDGKFSHQMIVPLAPCFSSEKRCLPACVNISNLPRSEGGRWVFFLVFSRNFHLQVGGISHPFLLCIPFSLQNVMKMFGMTGFEAKPMLDNPRLVGVCPETTFFFERMVDFYVASQNLPVGPTGDPSTREVRC